MFALAEWFRSWTWQEDVKGVQSLPGFSDPEWLENRARSALRELRWINEPNMAPIVDVPET